MDFLTVGQIVRTVGLKGEVKIYPSTHFRDTRFKKGNRVFLLNSNNEIEKELTIKIHHQNGDCDQVIFDEISSIEEAEQILHRYLFVEKDQNFLKENTYFYSDLIGLKAVFDNDLEIGTVIKIEEYNSYATLRVKTASKDVLIPFVKAFISSVSLENKIIVIKYIKGLI